MPSSHCHLVSSGTVISSFQASDFSSEFRPAPSSSRRAGLRHLLPEVPLLTLTHWVQLSERCSRPGLSIPFAFTEMQGTEQCTALEVQWVSECCDKTHATSLVVLNGIAIKKCCLVAKSACMTNSDCCSGFCRSRNSQCSRDRNDKKSGHAVFSNLKMKNEKGRELAFWT
jgi:hypothetical protein